MIVYDLVSSAANDLLKMKEELDMQRKQTEETERLARLQRSNYEGSEKQVRAVCAMLFAATGQREEDLLKKVGLSPPKPEKVMRDA